MLRCAQHDKGGWPFNVTLSTFAALRGCSSKGGAEMLRCAQHDRTHDTLYRETMSPREPRCFAALSMTRGVSFPVTAWLIDSISLSRAIRRQCSCFLSCDR